MVGEANVYAAASFRSIHTAHCCCAGKLISGSTTSMPGTNKRSTMASMMAENAEALAYSDTLPSTHGPPLTEEALAEQALTLQGARC